MLVGNFYIPNTLSSKILTILERPKLTPYIEQIVTAQARILLENSPTTIERPTVVILDKNAAYEVIMMKGISTLCASLALLLFSVAGYATQIKANYTVNLNDTDGEHGLLVHSTEAALNPFSFTLNEGASTTFDLFYIWTDEGWVNDDDTNPKPISVDFGFLMPDVFTGSVDGTTNGYSVLEGFFQGGVLTWDGPGIFSFGPNGDGQLRVSLTDETFNDGWLGTDQGPFWAPCSECAGATIQATITLEHNATAAVPEPGTLALFGIGLLGIAVTARKSRRYA